jgi:predicted phage tail protein
MRSEIPVERPARTMALTKGAVQAIVGVLLCVVGVVWIGQGLGAIGGSFMTGHPVWAAVGVPCLVAGLALLARATAIRRHGTDPDA